jgi:hypothetical protein
MTLPKNYTKKSSVDIMRTGTTKPTKTKGSYGKHKKTGQIIKELKKSNNWKPSITRISKNTGVAISTVADIYRRYEDKFVAKIRVKT